MGIGSLQNCEDEQLGVKWQKCVKFLGIFITYDVKQLVEEKKAKKKQVFGSFTLAVFWENYEGFSYISALWYKPNKYSINFLVWALTVVVGIKRNCWFG